MDEKREAKLNCFTAKRDYIHITTWTYYGLVTLILQFLFIFVPKSTFTVRTDSLTPD